MTAAVAVDIYRIADAVAQQPTTGVSSIPLIQPPVGTLHQSNIKIQFSHMKKREKRKHFSVEKGGQKEWGQRDSFNEISETFTLLLMLLLVLRPLLCDEEQK